MHSDLSVNVTDAWRERFPDAHVGLLVVDGASNPSSHRVLGARVREIEERLRAQFAGADRATLIALPAIQAYQRHYRTFGQTYHVLRQLESVALKGRQLVSGGALVLSMFAVELQTLLLTAGHDLDAVQPPLIIDRSNADEGFVGLGGTEHVLRGGDMLMRDSVGIISAVVYGPDQRTRLGAQTQRVMFTTYAPAGIDAVSTRRHLEDLAVMVRLVAPAATTQLLDIFP